jgi:hypothetical protein
MPSLIWHTQFSERAFASNNIKIADQPFPCIPAYINEHTNQPPQPATGVDALPHNNLPLGGPIYRVTPSGTTNPLFPITTKLDSKQVADAVLRFLSNRVAEHYGQNAVLAKNVVWLCFDLKKLHDKMREPGADKHEELAQVGELLSESLTIAALIPKLDGAEWIATSIGFIMKAGDMTYRGSATLSHSDIAGLLPDGAGDSAHKEVFDILNALGIQI